jgi:hypothetical protein
MIEKIQKFAEKTEGVLRIVKAIVAGLEAFTSTLKGGSKSDG